MLDIYIAKNEKDINKLKLSPKLSLGGSIYWYLHRYFVQADLDPGSFSFLNLYEDTTLSDYQLKRLKDELEEALIDLRGRSQTFKVLVGWRGDKQDPLSEEWQEISRESVENVAKDFILLIDEAMSKNISLYAIGD